jgi:uncharacterized protein (TIGR03435 family)
MAFEVASIRASAEPTAKTTAGMQITQRQFRASFISLNLYIINAFQLRSHELVGPEWLGTTRFDISATLPEETTPPQVMQMLQTLLAERFQLRFHREQRELPVYALVVGGGGLKIVKAPDDQPLTGPLTVTSGGDTSGAAVDLGGGSYLTMGNNRLEVKQVTMTTMAEILGRFVDRPVVNMTNVDGRFDFVLDVMPEDYQGMMLRLAHSSGNVLPPQALKILETARVDSLLDALRKIGLSLDARRAPVDALVVDSILKTPTDN